MTLPELAAQALQDFGQARDWEARNRLLLQWANRLPLLPEAERSDALLVPGCQSPVWLQARQLEGQWQFRAASQSRLMAGLLALVLVRIEGMNSASVAGFALPEWLAKLGLARQLSASRSNGLNAIWQQLQRQLALH